MSQRASQSGRAGADLRVAEATVGDDVIVPLDSKQLVVLSGIDDTDYWLQDQFWVKKGADLDDGAVSYKLSIVNRAETSQLTKIFHGAHPNVTVCAFGSEMASVNEVIQKVIAGVDKLNKLTLVLFEDVQDSPEPFLNQALAVRGNVTFNPCIVVQADRPLGSIVLKKQLMARVLRSKPESRQSRQQPKFRQLRMFMPGEDTDVRVFQGPAEDDKMTVVQYRQDWEAELFDELNITKAEAVVVPGADTRQSRYLFCKLKLADAHRLVEMFGRKARFSAMPLPWYKGDGVDDKEHRYELYISAEKRGQHAAFLFSYVLAMFWEHKPEGVLKVSSGVAIQVVGFNKIRVGLSKESNALFSEQLEKATATYGLKVKDESTGFFVNPEDCAEAIADCPPEWGDTANAFLINVPPWWGMPTLSDVLGTASLDKVVLKRMRWSVGEIRTMTWRLSVPAHSVKELNGSVFRASDGGCVMQVISSAEYAARRAKAGGTRQGDSQHKSQSSGAASDTSPMECDVIKFNKRKR